MLLPNFSPFLLEKAQPGLLCFFLYREMVLCEPAALRRYELERKLIFKFVQIKSRLKQKMILTVMQIQPGQLLDIFDTV